jgi:CRISPR-associated protein Cmr1
MRKQPAITPPVINTNQYQQARAEQIGTQVREYRLITPLFGGGVLPAEADPVTIIRGSEIRGHLRFWWRACRGGQFNNDLQRMKEVEDKIWGAANTNTEEQKNSENIRMQDDNKKQYKQPVQIEVDIKNRGIVIAPYTIVRNKDKTPATKRDDKPKYQPRIKPAFKQLAYAIFPLQPTQEELDLDPLPETRKVRQNVSFKLTISFPKEYQQDVEAALWAWETFGGLGARTRRGFGALQRQNPTDDQDIAPRTSCPQVVSQWINDHLKTYITENYYPANVPHLSRTPHLYVAGSQPDALVAWNNLIKNLASFRQAPDGRDQRSKWPEAEEIRELTNRDYRSKRLHSHKFPRAAFGLPIIFHFKDGVPDDVTLQIKDYDRFASPLILRSLVCQDGKAVGLAILLEPHTPPGDLILKISERKTRRHVELAPVDALLQVEEARQIDVPVIREGQTDVLLAFMNYLKGDR